MYKANDNCGTEQDTNKIDKAAHCYQVFKKVLKNIALVILCIVCHGKKHHRKPFISCYIKGEDIYLCGCVLAWGSEWRKYHIG